MIEPNEYGEVECPNCGICYEPKLARPEGDDRPVQELFPRAPAWQREQLISGVGCEACWDEFLTGATDKTCSCGE